MDIGTSKPGLVETKNLRYHLIDVVEPDDQFSAGKYKTLADEALMDILDRKRKPLLVGGSGLYFRALVDNLDFSGMRTTDSSRAGLNQEFKELGNCELHGILADLDAAAASSIDTHNRRRILRAIEVARSGNRLISVRQESWENFCSPYELKAAGLEMDRSLLYRLIESRVDDMISEGFIEEVKTLSETGKLVDGTTAGEAIGYKQMTAYISGQVSLEETVALIKKKTRNYAKRQMTWFKKDQRIKWFRIEAKPSDSMDKLKLSLMETAAEILEYMAY